MKKIITLVLFGISIFSNAQQKISFAYDAAGNQIRRELCLSGCDPLAKSEKEVKEIEALTDEDLLKFTPGDFISYYPNPVREELYLKWESTDDNAISFIQVSNLNGQILKRLSNLERLTTQNIPFGAYPSGIYLIVLNYSNGQQKTIKIIKK
jgi:hypothetical protein